MKRISILLTLTLVLLASCSHQGGTVYLSDYLTAEAEADAMPAIRAALDECRRTHAAELVLPEGELNIHPEASYERYQCISNNDESLKHIAFDLGGMSHFAVRGQNTTLLFTGFISPFSLQDCADITISGLSIDYTHTFHSEGLIRGTGDGYLDVEFPADYRIGLDNGCLYIMDNEWETYPFGNMLEYDPVKDEVAFDANDYWLSRQTLPAEQIGDRLYRIHKENIKATVGNVMVLGAAARLNPGFFIADSHDILIKDVNLYHCGGMGVIAQMSRNIELNKLVIIPSPGKGRVVSITADATHFVNCSGYIRMIDCTFRNQKDDATNIHGLYMGIDRQTSPRSLQLSWRNGAQQGLQFLRPGMTVEIVRNKTMTQLCRATVKSVEVLNRHITNVTFTADLPEGIEPDMVVAADDAYPDVLISGCTFSGNRARGLLLGSRGKMVLENNYFHIPGAAILFEGDGNYWFEQSGVRDVTIRNNVFENCNFGYRVWGNACISVGSGVPDRTSGECYHRGITIEDNTFRVFDPRILYLYSVDGLTFRNNRIEMTTDYPYLRGVTERFRVSNDCKNIDIQE